MANTKIKSKANITAAPRTAPKEEVRSLPDKAKRTSLSSRPAKAADVPQRPSGKLGLVVDLLASGNGATVAELAERMGWQQHTVHGALSRLRSRGFAMQRHGDDDRNAYRLARTEG